MAYNDRTNGTHVAAEMDEQAQQHIEINAEVSANSRKAPQSSAAFCNTDLCGMISISAAEMEEKEAEGEAEGEMHLARRTRSSSNVMRTTNALACTNHNRKSRVGTQGKSSEAYINCQNPFRINDLHVTARRSRRRRIRKRIERRQCHSTHMHNAHAADAH